MINYAQAGVLRLGMSSYRIQTEASMTPERALVFFVLAVLAGFLAWLLYIAVTNDAIR